jgi:prepilin peptidase CpaA
MLPWTTIALWILLVAATFTDILYRRIPNGLILVGLLGGLFSQAWLGGFAGLGLSLFGVLVGFLVLIGPFAMGRMGGGDVKLVMVCGAFLGWRGALHVILLGAIAHAILAVVFAILLRLGARSDKAALDLKRVPHAVGFALAGVLYSLGFLRFF